LVVVDLFKVPADAKTFFSLLLRKEIVYL